MEKIIILFFLLFFATDVQASELLGTISTSPSANNNQTNIPGATNPASATNAQKPVSSYPAFLLQSKVTAKPQTNSAKKVEVLGITHYADGSLLRDSRGKIFLIHGEIKKHILNLQDLRRYARRKMYQASDEVLADYKDGHLDGDLVREKGAKKIYVLVNGKKKSISNWAELRSRYFGREIFNITKAEINFY